MAIANSSWLTMAQRIGRTEEMFRSVLKQFGFDLRVGMPGIIQSFDDSVGTVVVRIPILEIINVITSDGQGGSAPVPTPTPIPLLLDVPVLAYGGGGFSITAPITAGDECIVLFGDMCINSWWSTGGTPIPKVQGGGGSTDKAATQEEKRRHDLSDAMAIVGLRNKTRALSNWNTDALEIRSDDGQTLITVEDGQITITPDGGTTTVVIKPNLITMTSTIVNVVGTLEVNGVPVTVP